MSRKQSSRKENTSDRQKREKGNLGQKEARLEKEKASELAHMGEKTHGFEKREEGKNPESSNR
jgi:hypothetical protein